MAIIHNKKYLLQILQWKKLLALQISGKNLYAGEMIIIVFFFHEN